MSSRETLVAERMTEPILIPDWVKTADGQFEWVKSLSVRRKLEILTFSQTNRAMAALSEFPDVLGREPPSPVFRIENEKMVWLAPRSAESKLAVLERLAVSPSSALRPYIGIGSRSLRPANDG